MTHKSKANNIPQAEIDKIAEEIYAYFKDHNARMTQKDVILHFNQYHPKAVDEAFAKVLRNHNDIQNTWVDNTEQKAPYGGYYKIFGYSKDGTDISGEGYWVRGPIRINKKGFARIPTQMFKGFLISQPRRVEIINQMIWFAIYDRSLYCGSPEKAAEFLYIDSKDPKGSAEEGRKVSLTIRTRSYYFLELSKLFKIRDDSQCTNEKAALFLINYALGSIKGNREWQKTNKKFLFSRMDGNDSPVDPEEWSEEIKAISTRAKFDRLKHLVTKYYGVTFFGARMRGFAFSMKYTEKELAAIVAVKVKEGKQKSVRTTKKEKTQAETLQEMLDWITRKDLSMEDVKKRIDEVRFQMEEQKRKEEVRKRREADDAKY